MLIKLPAWRLVTSPTPFPPIGNGVADHANVLGHAFIDKLPIVLTGEEIRCPLCASEPSGVLQVSISRAETNVDDEDRTVSFDGIGGTDTDSLWNNTIPLTFDGLPVLICHDNGHHFAHRDITEIDD
jgi:hypothetical protein